ncbi:MAG: hypothetical protein R3D55_14505 [Chloroflexota bacterium]
MLLGAEFGATAFDMLDEIRTTHPDTRVLVMGVAEQPALIMRYIEARGPQATFCKMNR